MSNDDMREEYAAALLALERLQDRVDEISDPEFRPGPGTSLSALREALEDGRRRVLESSDD